MCAKCVQICAKCVQIVPKTHHSPRRTLDVKALSANFCPVVQHTLIFTGAEMKDQEALQMKKKLYFHQPLTVCCFHMLLEDSRYAGQLKAQT